MFTAVLLLRGRANSNGSSPSEPGEKIPSGLAATLAAALAAHGAPAQITPFRLLVPDVRKFFQVVGRAGAVL